jgi:hypothetical protein
MYHFGKKMPPRKKKGIRISGGHRQPILYNHVDESRRSYEIILHNNHPGYGATTLDIVRGMDAARESVERRNRELTQEQRGEGWSHYAEPTARNPWPKPKRIVANRSGKSAGNKQ